MTYQGQMLGLKLPSLPESEKLNHLNQIDEKLKELEDKETAKKPLPI